MRQKPVSPVHETPWGPASGLYEKKAVLGKIQNELDAIRGANGGSVILSLTAGGDLSGRGETGSGGFMSGRCVGYRFCPQRPDQNTLCYAVPVVWNRTRRRRTLWSACSGKSWRTSTAGSICGTVKDAAGDVREEEALAESFRCSIRIGCRSRSSILRRCVSSGKKSRNS